MINQTTKFFSIAIPSAAALLLLLLAVGIPETSAEDYQVNARYRGGSGGSYYDVVHDGEYLYAAHFQGMSILNVSNASDLFEVSFVHTAGSARGVEVSGDYAYIADGPNGLVIVNISDPENTVTEGHQDTPDQAWEVAVSGDFAFVADETGGLIIVNISDRSKPFIAGQYDSAGHARGVAVSGDFAYLADYDNDFLVINVSDPGNPDPVGHLGTSGNAWDVCLRGDLAYLADEGNGLVIVNISDPGNPEQEGVYNSLDNARGVAVSGGFAYMANANGLAVINITNKNEPQLEGHYRTYDEAQGVAILGNHSYVADWRKGMTIVNVSDPENPDMEGHFFTAGDIYGIAVSGEHAYLADYKMNDLVIANINDTKDAFLVGQAETSSGFTRGVAADGDLAFMACSWALVIVNVSDPENPVVVGDYETDGPLDVAVRGNFAYVADGSNGLMIVNISDPANPTLEGSYDTDGEVRDVAVDGDFAYLADGFSGIVIVNISDPGNPTLGGINDTVEYAGGVTVSGDYAYVAGSTYGLIILNISDPANPVIAGSFDTEDRALDVAVSGDYAYVADEENGLVVVDVSDPFNPVKAGHYDTAGSALDVAVKGDYVYVADWLNGMVIVELAPMARIDDISPDTGIHTEEVQFSGSGTCRYDADIMRYVWRSSVDGEIHNSTNESNFTTDGLAPGTHTIYFRVQDSKGMWSDEVRETLIVTEKPVAHIDSITPGLALEGDSVHFSGHGTDDGTITLYRWRSSMDGEIYNGTINWFDWMGLSNGTHTIYFSVRDDNGIWSEEVVETLTVNGKPRAYIDLISPDTALVTEPVSFTGHGTDDGTITRYAWRSGMDGEFYNDTQNDIQYDGLSAGEHAIYLKVQDDNGAWSEEVQGSLTVTAKPVAIIDPGMPSVALDTDNVHFIGNGTDDGSIARYAWRSSISGEFYNDTGNEFHYQGLSSGEHTLYLKVQDNHGYWSDEVSADLTIVSRPVAVIDSISPNPVIHGHDVHFSGSGMVDETIARYAWSSDNTGEFHNGTEMEFDYSGLPVHEHIISLWVMDIHGFWSNESTSSLSVLADFIPYINILNISQPGPEVSGIVTITGSSRDVNGNDTLVRTEVSLDGVDWMALEETTSWTYRWNTTELLNGQYTLHFRSFDGFQYSEPTTVSLDVQNVPPNEIPVVTIHSPPDNSKVSGMVTLSGSATDTEGSVMNVEISINGGAWITATGLNSWSHVWDTTTVENGNYKIEVRAYDGEAYSDILTWHLNVDNGETPADDDDDDDPAFGAAAVLLAVFAVVAIFRREILD